MSTYCDPLIESWEWHDADTWHTPKRDRFDRTDALPVATRPVAIADVRPPKDVFNGLVSAWREETENLSSFTKIVQNSSYQEIIRLGKGNPSSMVEMILQELRNNGGYWATALQAITGENPVRPEHIGDQGYVREDWLEWGKQHGYI
jgi:hypothetical protein